MTKPNYDEWAGCPIRYAMGILGDHWSFLIVRDAVFNGFVHYRDFLKSGEGISTNVLATRLARLESKGVFEKHPDPMNRSSVVYLLTRKGMDLIPVLLQLIVWSSKHDLKTDVPIALSQSIKSDPDAVARRLALDVEARNQSALICVPGSAAG